MGNSIGVRLKLPAGVLAAGLLCSGAVPAQEAVVQAADNEAGRAVYETHCAACHDRPEETKSPAAETLRQMGPRAVSYALTNGGMREQAAGLTPAEINAVVDYLSATADIDNDWIADNMCPRDRARADTGVPATVGGFGINLRNHRRMTAEQAGLAKEDMQRLELKWAMGFPQVATMRSQPVIAGNTLYLAVSDSGQLFALDIGGVPCVKWVYEHSVPLRSSINTGTLEDGRTVLVFGDAAAHVQMVDAARGELLWRTGVKVTSVANTTGMPVLYKDKVYAPVSSGELNMGAAPDYECCTSHGAVVALDAASGEEVWTHHTMEDATPRGVNRVGTQLWGPSGAPIWTTPAIDEERGVLYVGTGQNTSEPPTDTSDAVLAIDLEDGSLRWKFQATENDIFLTGCLFNPDGPNCPPDYSVNADWDFGASMVIAERPDGSDIVLAGQKSGMLWALDPDNNGELLWSTDVGPGGPVGGIHWGMAYDGDRIFAAVNQVGMMGEDPEREPGLHAVDVDSGEILWSYINEPDCAGDREERMPSCGRNYGMSAATLLVDGAVIQGANDGYLKIFDGQSGELLFSYDTAREFDTVNGVPASGGSIDNASVVAANGMLLVQSGYGLLGAPGNVLLAFAPRE